MLKSLLNSHLYCRLIITTILFIFMGNNLFRGTESLDVSLKHPKISNAQLITSSNRQVLRVLMPSDEVAYKKWTDALDKSNKFQHEHLLLPLNYKFTKKGLCASTGGLQIDFPNNSVLLSEEITNRQANQLAFTQGQLWYLLYALLSAKSYIKESQKDYPCELIGDVRPQNILINPQGEVRFVNLLSWPGQKINYHKTFDGIVTYLSPEDYETLQLGKLNNDSNHQSSEAFSVGFTLVLSALLIDNPHIYDIQSQKFNHFEAQKIIDAFKVNNSYSELLRAVISGLCVLNSSKRLVWNDVWNWIRKYEKSVSEKKDFCVDEIPRPINQQIMLFRSQVSKIRLETIEADGKRKEHKRLPAQLQNEYTGIQARQVAKSTLGFYSPRKLVTNNGQQAKVFIQYKSPGKGSSEPESASQSFNAKKQQLNIKTSHKLVPQKPNLQTQFFAQKITSQKEESNLLNDDLNLKRTETANISERASINKEQKPIIEQKPVSIANQTAPVISQKGKQISEEHRPETITQNKIKTVGSSDVGSLNLSTHRSRSVKKNDFLDDVMQVNKVLNKQQHKDYAKENKYLNVEEGYEKK